MDSKLDFLKMENVTKSTIWGFLFLNSAKVHFHSASREASQKKQINSHQRILRRLKKVPDIFDGKNVRAWKQKGWLKVYRKNNAIFQIFEPRKSLVLQISYTAKRNSTENNGIK